MTASRVQFGNPWAFASAAQFAQSLKGQLPQGDAWGGTVMGAFLAGVAQAFGDLQANAGQLSENETVPSRTDILMQWWNADFGLPDCCTPLGSTLQQQRNSLLAKLAQVGGQNEAYFISVAAALRWQITITRGAVGSYTWTINAAAAVPPSVFRVGENRAGDRLETIGINSELECVMDQIAPAHGVLNFNFT